MCVNVYELIVYMLCLYLCYCVCVCLYAGCSGGGRSLDTYQEVTSGLWGKERDLEGGREGVSVGVRERVSMEKERVIDGRC